MTGKKGTGLKHASELVEESSVWDVWRTVCRTPVVLYMYYFTMDFKYLFRSGRM
jgi:hypothetical protein